MTRLEEWVEVDRTMRGDEIEVISNETVQRDDNELTSRSGGGALSVPITAEVLALTLRSTRLGRAGGGEGSRGRGRGEGGRGTKGEE